MDAMVSLDKSSDSLHLNIYYYEAKDDDRTINPVTRKKALQDLIKYFDQTLDPKTEYGKGNFSEFGSDGSNFLI